MMETGATKLTGTAYEIRVKDHRNTYWTTFFEGWSVNNLGDGEVVLRNPQVDQSGLHGVLNRIRDLKLTLLSVRTID